MTLEQKRRIFDIVTRHLNIEDSDNGLWEQFSHQWPECLEFRILSFSGVKVRYRPGYADNPGQVYVDCYPEENRDYADTIANINAELRAEGLEDV